MGVAALGSYLGGISQGQQQAEEQRQRAQYLAMLQKKATDADYDKQSSADAVFANSMSDVAPAPSPGTASMPKNMAMPGAQPMPGAGGPPPQGQTAYAGTTPVPQGPPQGAPQQPQPQVPQQNPQVQSPQPSAAPQTPAPQPQAGPAAPPAGDGFDQAAKILQQTQAALATPAAQKIAEDPKVQHATEQYHAYVKELKDAGFDPTKPGSKKPDLVQMKRLQLLHDQLGLAAADASKHVSEDRKTQYEFGTKYADLFAKQEAAKLRLQGTQETNRTRIQAAGITAGARAASGGGRGNAAEMPYDQLSAERRAVVDGYIDYAQAHNGKFPTGTGYNDPLKQTATAEMQRRGITAQGTVDTNASNQADTRGVNIATQKLAVLEPSYSAFEKNFDQLEKTAKTYGLQGNQPLNTIINTIRQKAGVEQASAFEAAVRTVQTEYGKIMNGSTGAAGASVAALKKAGDSISENMTLGQLQAVRKVLETDGKNVLDGFRAQQKKLSNDMRSRNKPGASGGAASKGGVYLAPNGKTYTRDQINDAANAANEDPEAFAASRGLKIGN